jgi:hypothetical protein
MKLVYDLRTEINVLTQRRRNHLRARGKNKKGRGGFWNAASLEALVLRIKRSMKIMYKNPVHTSEERSFFSITKTDQLMLCR